MSSAAFSQTRLDRMHGVMAGYVDRGDLPGLVTLVSRRGEVHVDAIGKMAFGSDEPMQRDTIFRIASLTKPIVAVAAMILVEECTLRLDQSVERWLPELANRQVLKSIESPITETVPANRPITLRDLLTFRLGIGLMLAKPDTYPIQTAIAEAGLAPGPNPPSVTPDEWMARLGSLTLIHQPGEAWMYHTGSDVLSVLIARASGQPLETFLQERLFTPLGMKDTGFYVPADKMNRLPPVYAANHETGTLGIYDDPRNSLWANPPVFPSGGGGLVSTVDDYLAFSQMMLNKGKYGSERILSRPSVELMTMDHLTSEQKVAASPFFEGSSSGWGFGMGIDLHRTDLASNPGRFGWTGGKGTSAYTDPTEEMIGILMTQRLMDSPEPPNVFVDFWTSAYQAID